MDGNGISALSPKCFLQTSRSDREEGQSDEEISYNMGRRKNRKRKRHNLVRAYVLEDKKDERKCSLLTFHYAEKAKFISYDKLQDKQNVLIKYSKSGACLTLMVHRVVYRKCDTKYILNHAKST